MDEVNEFFSEDRLQVNNSSKSIESKKIHTSGKRLTVSSFVPNCFCKVMEPKVSKLCNLSNNLINKTSSSCFLSFYTIYHGHDNYLRVLIINS